MTTPGQTAARERFRCRQALLAAIRSGFARGDWRGVETRCRAALETMTECPAARFALAMARIEQHDLAEAAALLQELQAQAAVPSEVSDMLAVVHAIAGDLASAVFYRKLAQTGASSPMLRQLIPANLPNLAQALANIREQPLLQLADGMLAAGDVAAADWWLRQHLWFQPDCREASLALGGLLLRTGQIEAAVATLRAARHRRPDDAELASLLARSLACLGESAAAAACHAEAVALAPDSSSIAAARLRDSLSDPATSDAGAVASFRLWGARFGAVDDQPITRSADAAAKRLTLGYVFAGEGADADADADALAEILMHRDHSRFAAVGFGDGPLSRPANMALQRCVDRWVDAAGADPATFAMMVKNERIDLLVDLAGLAAPQLHLAFARRMAPCQVAWLGMPYPTGLPGIDFVLTDRVLEPEGSRLAVWPARRQHLALGAVVVPALPPPPDRPASAAAGAAGPVLAAEATLADLSVPQIALWASVLQNIPRAVLVLRQGALAEPAAARRLVDLFGNHGVAHRVEIADLPTAQALFATADLALVPSAQPRPAVIAAALAGGIPPLLLQGQLRHQLAAVSVLTHLGLAADCLAQSPAALVAAAAEWAADDERRHAFRARVADLRRSAPALNGEARMRDLETALTAMWRQTCAGAGEPTCTGADP